VVTLNRDQKIRCDLPARKRRLPIKKTVCDGGGWVSKCRCCRERDVRVAATSTASSPHEHSDMRSSMET
jgi:hypothetical protein